jgi:SAM-dependent methyltransferase
MSWLRSLHGQFALDRRTRVLGGVLSELMPHGATVLDVGCGDARLGVWLADARPDVRWRGIDVVQRAGAPLPVERFDGTHIDSPDASFDVALLVDVVHHARDPLALLSEVARVGRTVALKDHTCESAFAAARLRFMDRVGNPPNEVEVTGRYWSRARWHEVFRQLGLSVGSWRSELALYPPPVDWLFGRGLHFVAQLSRRAQ